MCASVLPSTSRARTASSSAGVPAATASARSHSATRAAASGSATARACSAPTIGTGAPKRSARRELGVGHRDRLLAAPEVRERQRRGRAPRRPGRVRAPALLAQRPAGESLGEGALVVALGQPQARAGVDHRALPRHPLHRAVQAALAQHVAGLVEGAALGQRRTRARWPPAREHADVVVDEAQRRARLVLGLGEAAAAQREVGGVPGRRGVQPQRAALHRVVAQARDRGVRLVGVVGQHERARGQVVGRAPPGVVQQLVALERLARERRDGRRVGHAALGRPPTRGGRGRCGAARGRRWRSTSIAATRRTRSSWRAGIVISVSSAAASIASRVPGSVSGGQLLLEERRQPRLVDVDDVQRREPGQDVEPAVAVVRLGQGLAQALARTRAGRRRRRPSRARPAGARGRRPGRAPSARARGRPRRCGARRVARRRPRRGAAAR